jgi:hypothetical protein
LSLETQKPAMSKGPGRIERAIRELFDANLDLAFVTDELAEHCFPDVRPIERKHQVSVLRAAQKIVAADLNWEAWRIEGQGRGWVFVNRDSVQSYALGRLIGDQCNIYRSEKRARRKVGYYDDFYNQYGAVPGGSVEKRGHGRRIWAPCGHLNLDRAALLKQLESPGRQEMIAPGGAWHRHTMEHRAERDGDTATAQALKAESDAAHSAAIHKRFAARNGAGNETLTKVGGWLGQLANEARTLQTQNDPDAVRHGLAALADALDRMKDLGSHA